MGFLKYDFVFWDMILWNKKQREILILERKKIGKKYICLVTKIESGFLVTVIV